MNSKERHEARYQRRKAKREHKILSRALQYTRWNDIYGTLALVDGYRKVSKASKDKTSTQMWMANLTVNARTESRKLMNGTWKSPGYHRFMIKERGKWRDIQSAHISEKGIQNSFVNSCYVPIISPHLIYDNGASLKNKGTDFSIKRFTKHLRDHAKKYGRNGYIFFFDFKSYFTTINQDKIVSMSKPLIWDKRILKTYETFTRAFGPGGLGLGSPVSQISALLYPNSADHLVKDHFGIKGYGRHMDDGYIICNSLSKLKIVIKEFKRTCENLGIIMNSKKCHIIRLDRPFRFLKVRFFITETGKVIRRTGRHLAVNERKKLRAYRKFLDLGLMAFDEIYLNFHSWLMSLRPFHTFHLIYNIVQYFNIVFCEYKNYRPTKLTTRKYKVVDYISRIVARQVA